MQLHVLILGGTTEGRLLGERLAHDERHRVLLSYAGRTERIRPPPVPHRVGGFGGAEGLAAFLRQSGFDALIDATHPFAARISANAVVAARSAGIPLLRVARPKLEEARSGFRWVASMEEAARALGPLARRVFLTVGRLEVGAFGVAPHHDYLIRAVDDFDPGLPRARVLCARGPFRLEEEQALLVRERIELLVSKDAGSEATSAKLVAARALNVPVIMVRRPVLPAAHEVERLEDVLTWLAALYARKHGR